MSDTIICALIAAGASTICTLVTAIGTFHASIKKDREKAKEELKAELIKYHEKNKEEIKEIRDTDLKEIRKDVNGLGDDLSAMGANLQNKIAIVELELGHTRSDIVTLSSRVEKHNGVIERVFHLEDTDKLLEEKIKVANHRLDDLERKTS